MRANDNLGRRRVDRATLALAALGLLGLPGAAAHSTNYTWIGGTGEWCKPTNWTPNVVPTASDYLLVSSGYVYDSVGGTVLGPSGGVNGLFTGSSTSADLRRGLLAWQGGVVQVASGANVAAKYLLVVDSGSRIEITDSGSSAIVTDTCKSAGGGTVRIANGAQLSTAALWAEDATSRIEITDNVFPNSLKFLSRPFSVRSRLSRTHTSHSGRSNA